MLESGHGLDPASLKRLLEQLERFSVEASLRPGDKPESAEVANFDPARLPPSYRSRIERYFQKLSEE
jgi:hypothetical protein